MFVNGMECCALNELADIGTYRGDSEKVLEQYCLHLKRWRNDQIDNPGAFVVFTGVVKLSKRDSDYEDFKAIGFDYAPKFAAFLRKNRLGPVVETITRRNRVNHPSHSIRAFIWAPNPKSLKRWWVAFNAKKEAERLAAQVPIGTSTTILTDISFTNSTEVNAATLSL